MSEPESHEAPADQAVDAAPPQEAQPGAIAEGEIFPDAGGASSESDPFGSEVKAKGIDAILGVSMKVQIASEMIFAFGSWGLKAKSKSSMERCCSKLALRSRW